MSEQDKETVISEQVVSLFDGIDLTEETKTKVGVLFEAAVAERVSAEKQALVEQYDALLEEAKQEIAEEYEAKIDEYLTYVAQEWMTENRLVAEQGIRTEIVESFIDDLRQVFETHNVTIPESKVDMFEDVTRRLAETEKTLNEALQQNVKISKFASELQKEIILRESAADLSDAQAERLKSLAEDIEFVDAEQFAGKIGILKEAVARKPVAKQAENVVVVEDVKVEDTKVIVEETKVEPTKSPSTIEATMAVLSRMGK